VVTAHDLVTRKHVFEYTREDVMDARFAVCSWRTFIEDILRRTISSVLSLLQDTLPIPILKHLGFHGYYIEFGRNWFKHSTSLPGN
jgi:hypothetical protein